MRYIIHQKYFSFNDKFNIEDDRGYAAYQVNSKLVSIPKQFTICMPDGRELVKIKKRIRLGFTKFDVCTMDGKHILTIHRKFKVYGSKISITSDAPSFGNCTLTGSITNWNFSLVRDADSALMATISKKWLRIADTYAVDVADIVGKNDYLVLAIAICIDYMFHREH